MKVYHPKITVKLVKATKRKEITTGLDVVKKRYQALDAIDLTPYLGDNGSVTTTKSVRNPTGGFQIVIPDKMHKELQETIYALVEPMDLVEIRMSSSYDSMPIVMRGFVSNVSRSEAMGGGPERYVTISGHDFAKILQTILIHFNVYSDAATYILNEFRFFYEYAGADSAKIKPAAGFVSDMLKGIINPYMKGITALADGRSVNAKVINAWTPKVSIAGSVSPFILKQFVNNSLYDIMRTVLDVGVFNEMYVVDTEDGAELVVRPVPARGVDGEFIQGKADEISIGAVDIKGYTASRSDDGVANYFWVTNEAWSLRLNQDVQALAYIGDPKSFLLGDYMNTDQKLFGFRKMEVVTMLGDDQYTHSENIGVKDLPKQTQLMAGWLEKRRDLLKELNKDNLVFESGSMRVRGNVNIKAGNYVRVHRGAGGSVGSVYAHTVTHQFIPQQAFTTTIQFNRGTFFIERSRFPASPYIPEIEAQGVYGGNEAESHSWTDDIKVTRIK